VALAEKKTMSAHDLNECKTNNGGGGSIVGDATRRQGEDGA
jgi:hypothetical protein